VLLCLSGTASGACGGLPPCGSHGPGLRPSVHARNKPDSDLRPGLTGLLSGLPEASDLTGPGAGTGRGGGGSDAAGGTSVAVPILGLKTPT
jgi:hypothetical protein